MRRVGTRVRRERRYGETEGERCIRDELEALFAEDFADSLKPDHNPDDKIFEWEDNRALCRKGHPANRRQGDQRKCR